MLYLNYSYKINLKESLKINIEYTYWQAKYGNQYCTKCITYLYYLKLKILFK